METVLFVFPTLWDRKQLEACRSRWASSTLPAFAGPEDAECPWDFDILAFIEEMSMLRSGSPAGVTSSSDYPGATVAAAVAARRGLPGTPPAALLRAGNKFRARVLLAEEIPGVSPPFVRLDPGDPLPDRLPPFPCFVKPVKGSFSVLARRVKNRGELNAFLRLPVVSEFRRQYVRIFDELASVYAPDAESRGAFLVEGALPGKQATIEGYAFRGEITIMGAVDSILQPGTGSFIRFETPSRLPRSVQARMEATAARAARTLGLDHTVFNVEMTYDPRSGRIGIIEVNVRLCGQFADLHQSVDGTNTYEIALDLALGRPPEFHRGRGSWPAAVSLPLRVFEPCRVDRAPSPEWTAEIEARYPGTRIWTECRTGDVLDDFESLEDGWSFRYGVVNAGGKTRRDALRCAEEAAGLLGFAFSAVPRSVPADPTPRA